MGFRSSCAIWTAIARTLTRKWRKQGIRCLGYIDDFLFSCSSKEEVLRARDIIVKDIVALGLKPNFKKTTGVPGRRVKFLGFILDSMEMHM